MSETKPSTTIPDNGWAAPAPALASGPGRSRLLLLSLFGPVLYTLAFPPFSIGALALIAPAPLALLLLDPRRPLSTLQALAAGLIFGQVTSLAITGYWIYHAAFGFFGRSALFSLLFAVLITATHGSLFMGAVGLAASRLYRVGAFSRLIGFACVWVAVWEFGRIRLFYGNPWGVLGQAFVSTDGLVRIADLGGVWCLSWIAAATSAAAVLAYLRLPRFSEVLAMAALACALPLVLVGYAYLTAAGARPSLAEQGQASLKVALIQPNVSKRDLWLPQLRSVHLDQALAMSRAPELAGADVIIWPENAVPFLLDADSGARAKIHELADQSKAAVLVGAPRSEDRHDGRARFFNSVYFFAPGVPGYQFYDKNKLLPYVEAVPRWVSPLLDTSSGVRYSAGSEAVMFEVKGWKLAPLLCFESTYPRFARRYAAMGADILVNVSNDSWFDRGAGPEQHFMLSLPRAAENRLPFVRVANTGISAVADDSGRVISRLPINQRQVALVEVARGRGDAIYPRFGYWFPWFSLLIAVVVVARSWLAPPA